MDLYDVVISMCEHAIWQCLIVRKIIFIWYHYVLCARVNHF